MQDFDHKKHHAALARLIRKPPRRGMRKRTHFALGCIALVVTLTLGLTGVGFAWLTREPISLEFLRPQIVENLTHYFGAGFSVDLGPTVIARTPHGLGIGFLGLTVRDPRGRQIIRAPSGKIEPDLLSLLGLQIKVRRLQLDDLQLSLHIAANGEYSLSSGSENVANAAPIILQPASTNIPPSGLAPLIEQLTEGISSFVQPLDHIAIVNAHLTVRRDNWPQPTLYKDLQLTFDRTAPHTHASLSALGPSGRFSITTQVDDHHLKIEAQDLLIDDMLRLTSQTPAFSLSSPISFRLEAETSAKSQLTLFDSAFVVDAGTLALKNSTFVIDEITGKILLDKEGNFLLRNIDALANGGQNHIRFSGLIDTSMHSLHLHSSETVLATTRLNKVALDAHYDSSAVEIDALTAQGPNFSGHMRARLGLSSAGPEIRLDLAGAGEIRDALKFWPPFINGEARNWCVANMRGGELTSGSLKIDWNAEVVKAVLSHKPAPPDTVDGHFKLHKAAVTLLPGLPAVNDLDVSGFVTGRYFHVEAPHAIMELGDGKKLLGINLAFTVPDTKPAARIPAFGSAHIVSSAESLAQSLTTNALKPFVGLTLDPANVKGQFQGDLRLSLVLGHEITPHDQTFSATGILNHLSVEKLFGTTKLEQATLDIHATSTGFVAKGAGLLSDVPVKLEILRSGSNPGSVTITGVLDDAVRRQLGFNLNGFMQGPMGVTLKAPLDKSAAEVELDLTKMSLGAARWKAEGKAGKARFELKPGPDGVAVNHIQLDAGTVSARGSALFSSSGSLKTIQLSPFKMSAHDDLRLDLEGGAPMKMTLRGNFLDVSDFITHFSPTESQGDSVSDIKVSHILGAEGQMMNDVELHATRRAGIFIALKTHARLDGSVFEAHTDSDSTLHIHTQDAGALARFLNIYEKLEGGAADATLQQEEKGFSGSVTLHTFLIRNEPALRQLVESTPQTRDAPLDLTPASAPFQKLSARFHKENGKLEFSDTVLASGNFGLTAQGFIDFSTHTLDLNGVFVPLYLVNRALGDIPVLGGLLTGGRNEGMFAINYRVNGQTQDPKITMNPLSGITPGILRKIFGVLDGTTPYKSSKNTTPERLETSKP